MPLYESKAGTARPATPTIGDSLRRSVRVRPWRRVGGPMRDPRDRTRCGRSSTWDASGPRAGSCAAGCRLWTDTADTLMSRANDRECDRQEPRTTPEELRRRLFCRTARSPCRRLQNLPTNPEEPDGQGSLAYALAQQLTTQPVAGPQSTSYCTLGLNSVESVGATQR